MDGRQYLVKRVTELVEEKRQNLLKKELKKQNLLKKCGRALKGDAL